MVPTQGITWLFSCPDIIPIISIQGRKGDENYAIYTTISCARGQADGLAHIPEMNITVRQSRQYGVARATCPD